MFVYDSKRVPRRRRARSPELLAWAKKNPGRLTHPRVRNFLGATFLKQALYELAPDPAVLQRPATDENFAAVDRAAVGVVRRAAAAAVARGPRSSPRTARRSGSS